MALVYRAEAIKSFFTVPCLSEWYCTQIWRRTHSRQGKMYSFIRPWNTPLREADESSSTITSQSDWGARQGVDILTDVRWHRKTLVDRGIALADAAQSSRSRALHFYAHAYSDWGWAFGLRGQRWFQRERKIRKYDQTLLSQAAVQRWEYFSEFQKDQCRLPENTERRACDMCVTTWFIWGSALCVGYDCPLWLDSTRLDRVNELWYMCLHYTVHNLCPYKWMMWRAMIPMHVHDVYMYYIMWT